MNNNHIIRAKFEKIVEKPVVEIKEIEKETNTRAVVVYALVDEAGLQLFLIRPVQK